MRQYGLLAGVFGVTLAVLLVGFLVIEQLGANGAVAVASPSPSTAALPTPQLTPRPVLTPRPTPSRSPAPSASGPIVTAPPSPPQPTPTPRPPRSIPPTGKPGETIEVTLKGTDFIESVVPVNATVTKMGSGAVVMTSDRMYSDPTTLTYVLPESKVPAGTRIVRLDVAVCGNGTGDFWETYGPSDTDPIEHEVQPPDPDGCWHYTGGAGQDSTVFAIIHLESRFQIDKVVYTITTG